MGRNEGRSIQKKGDPSYTSSYSWFSEMSSCFTAYSHISLRVARQQAARALPPCASSPPPLMPR